MTDALTYAQRLKLGAIRVRREFADQARQRAAAAALLNDYRACEMLHAEADRHEAAIIEATRELGEHAPRGYSVVDRPPGLTLHDQLLVAAAPKSLRNATAIVRPIASGETPSSNRHKSMLTMS